MSSRNSTARPNHVGWSNQSISSRAETNDENSDAGSMDNSGEFSVLSRSSTDEQTIPAEHIGYFAKDYKDVKRIIHVSGGLQFSAVKKADSEPCLLYIVPYTKEDFDKLKKLKTEASKCKFLLNFARIEKKDDWILIEVPYAKNMLDIFDEMNPDYGLISDVPRDNFDEATIKVILMDVLRALQFIGKLGYVHTVVRATSLFVNTDGVVILGNLHMMRRSNELSLVTPYAHMPPEMIARLPNLNIRSKSLLAGLSRGFSYNADIWSLGMFILELVNLIDIDEFFDRIFMDLTDKKLAVKILKHEFPTLNTMEQAWNRKLSRLLIDFSTRCLNSDQDARWSVDRLLNSHSFTSMREPAPSVIANSMRAHQNRYNAESSTARKRNSKTLNYPMH